MLNGEVMRGTTTPSLHAPGSEVDRETSGRAAVNDQIDRMSGASDPTEEEAEGEGGGTLDEED